MMLGLTRPSSGTIRIGGHRYAELPDPMHQVGAVLGPDQFHPNFSGRNNLRAVARATGVGDRRVDELLDVVDLASAELLKLRSARAVWALSAVGVILASLQGIMTVQNFTKAIANVSRGELLDWGKVDLQIVIAVVIAMATGLLAGTSEFRHRTIITTFLARPDRPSPSPRPAR